MARPGLLFLLGVWVGLLAASWAIAPATFRTAERLLTDPRPELAARLAPLPDGDRRAVLRYVAAEVNRWMFGAWGVAQLVLGAAAVALAWRLGGAARWIALAAFALVAGQAFGLVPAIRELGQAAAFLPSPPPPEIGRRFGRLHGIYAALDLAKAALVVALAWIVGRAS